jgi:A/G-specific adenine glycosylase
MCVAHLTDRTAHLPTPRKKTRIPERHARWLVVLHGDVVLLEQRPATGLWGGLWSFPELHADETPTQAARRYGCVAKQFDALPTFRHSFTHFHLHVQALQTLLRGRRPKAPVQAAWVKVSDAIEQGVPTPVRTLLQRLPWQA